MNARGRLFRGRLRPRFQGIRFRLGVALGLALLPFLVLSAVQLRADFRQEAEERRQTLRLAAERSVADQKGLVQSTAAMLEVLALEGVGPGCPARLDAVDERLPDFDGLARFGPDGALMCGSEGAPARGGWLDDLRQGRRVVAAPVGGGRSGLVVALRLERPLGAFDGATAVVVPLEQVLPGRDLRNLPEGTQAALVTPDGRVLASTDPKTFEGTPARTPPPADTGQALVVEREGKVFVRAALIDDELHVLYAAPSPGLWSWALLNPIGAFLLPLGVWLAAFVAVMALSERFVIRWLDYLQRVAAIHARGRLSVRPIQAAAAPTEIRSLARTLDDLADGVTTRDKSLMQALEEKDALMREIHHRVKNNLQIISSLLSMQQRTVTDPAAKTALGDTRQRISALALIYRTLYQAEDLGRADMRDFLSALVGQMVADQAGRGQVIDSSVEADSLIVDPDKLAPMALWLVEAVSNAQKHAFSAGGGRSLAVRFRVDGETSVLEVEDDGPGLNPASATGVGRTLMAAFAKQLRGETEVLGSPSGGALVRMTFVTPGERVSGTGA
ncbi:MAG: sensor histidine kinase [Caulobacteraceae bacterium]|nr:sensor histidine kinase [Caulobacteraceae bacterium]